ncbi:MAG: hypothetical protein WD232_01305 [Acidimicrobiales bacterium]
MTRQGGKLFAGFVGFHVLCCGLPLLIATGAFTGGGGRPQDDNPEHRRIRRRHQS